MNVAVIFEGKQATAIFRKFYYFRFEHFTYLAFPWATCLILHFTL